MEEYEVLNNEVLNEEFKIQIVGQRIFVKDKK